MECKLHFAAISWARHNELIDTLWNVNPYGINYQSNGRKELIDTLWNVNMVSIQFSTSCIRN